MTTPLKTNHRTLFTLLIAGVVILILGIVRPPSPNTGVFDEQFWAEKMGWHHQLDVVVAGDSRVYRGVSPEVIAKYLPNLRIGNFGFSSAGYGKQYLKRLPDLFDPASKNKILLLGITPNALNYESAEEKNGFLEFLNDNPLDLRMQRTFGPVLGFFQPYSLSDVGKALSHKRKGYFQDFHLSGWVGSYKLPENRTEALETYRERWLSQKVSPAVEKDVFEHVSVWTSKGIRVYGFYPPHSKALHDLEAGMSGFNETRFKTDFQKAGGIWIDIDPFGYYSYDGSHLRKDGAIQLSREIGLALNPVISVKN